MKGIRKSDLRVVMLMVVVAVTTVCIMLWVEANSSENKVINDGVVDGIRLADDHGEETVSSHAKKRTDLKSFDPNTVDSLTLLQYGLGSVQIHSLMGYRRHNGTFDAPLAVSKLYNWSDEDVEKVLPYIVIGDKYKKTYKYREEYEKSKYTDQKSEGDGFHRQEIKEEYERKQERKYPLSEKFSHLTKVDINEADTTLLKKIPGVGTGIANAIVKLRDKLGGFHSVDQLKAIDYISPELYEWFEVSPKSKLHLININKASFQTLNAHPYITYNQARDLMSYRRLYGIIKDLDALSSINVFSKEEIERLSPYLEF